MKHLTRKSLRDLWKIKIRALGIVLLVAGGVCVYSGTLLGMFMMKNTAQTLYKDLHLADFQVTFSPVTDDEMPAAESIRAIPGVERSESRLVIPGAVELSGGQDLSSLLIFLKGGALPQVNSLRLTSGNYFNSEENESVLLEESFAREYDYKTGDTIRIGIQGFFSDFKVAGTAVNPEYLVWTSNPHFYIPVKGSLGIVYLPIGIMQKIFGYDIFNNISVTFAVHADPAIIQNGLEGLLKDKEIIRETPKEEQFTYRTVERRFKMHRVFLPTIILIFDVIAFLITFVTIDRMVHSQKREIGVLLALGYGRMRILGSYVVIGLILGLAGSLLGCVFAFPLSFAITDAYQRAIGFPIILHALILSPLLKGSLLGIGALIFASAIPAYKIVRLNPTQAFRDAGQFSFKGVSILFRGIELFFMRIFRFSAPVKIGFRNLFRHPRLFIFSVLSLGAAIGLIIAIGMSISSVNDTVQGYFKKEKWNVMVDFNGSIENSRLSEIKSIPGVRVVEPYLNGFVKLQYGNIQKPYQIVGVMAQGKLREISLLEGAPFLDDSAADIIINREMRDSLGIRFGQMLEIVTQSGSVFPVRVSGIMDNIVVGQAFVPYKTSERILGLEAKSSGILAATSGPAAELRKALHEKEFVGQVLVQEDARRTAFKSVEEVVRFLNIYRFLAVLVVITLVFTLQTINILERESEYAVLEAIGYTKVSMAQMIFTEVFIINILAALLSMPFSEWIGTIIRNRFAENAFFTIIPPRAGHYVANIIPVCVLVIVVTLFSLRYIYRMQIAGIIRNKIIG